MQGDLLAGALVVDKPAGWTSHDVVNKARRLLNTKKVGHLGTLDPSATGVLPLVVGRATRLAQFYTARDKIYEGTIQFGYATDTYDAEGTPTTPVTHPQIRPEEIDALLPRFRGALQQVPPAISAKKIDGKPAYKLARKQQTVELPPVEVTVYSLDILAYGEDSIRVRVHCSAGTYVRSIAHDLGQALGCGAFLRDLRRVQSGEFTLAHARTLEALQELAAQGRIAETLVPARELLPEFPGEPVDAETEARIRQGRDFIVSPFRAAAESLYVKAIAPDGQLVAIGKAKLPRVFHPVCVL